MKTVRFLAAASAASIACISAAPVVAATDSLRWGKVSGWDILIDTSLGNGCFIYTVYDGGTVLRLGFSPDDDEAYLMVGNMKWGSIEHGKDYDIELRMDRDAPWYATAMGFDFDGLPMLMAETDDSNFLVDFMKKNSLQVTYKKQIVATLSLKGTFAAISEMLNCQTQVDKYGIGNRAPVADPFAR
jgi:hypothetical protein